MKALLGEVLERESSADLNWLLELPSEHVTAIRSLLQALKAAEDPRFIDEDREYIIDALKRRVNAYRPEIDVTLPHH